MHFGIEVKSLIDKSLCLTSETPPQSETWVKTMTSKNAYFEMSKGGKTIQCDVRPTFQGFISEVQIVEFTVGGKFKLSVIDMNLAPDYINEMLS